MAVTAFLIFQTNSHVSTAACQFWFCDSFIIKYVRLRCNRWITALWLWAGFESTVYVYVCETSWVQYIKSLTYGTSKDFTTYHCHNINVWNTIQTYKKIVLLKRWYSINEMPHLLKQSELEGGGLGGWRTFQCYSLSHSLFSNKVWKIKVLMPVLKMKQLNVSYLEVQRITRSGACDNWVRYKNNTKHTCTRFWWSKAMTSVYYIAVDIVVEAVLSRHVSHAKLWCSKYLVSLLYSYWQKSTD